MSLFTELPRRAAFRKPTFRRCRFSETQREFSGHKEGPVSNSSSPLPTSVITFGQCTSPSSYLVRFVQFHNNRNWTRTASHCPCCYWRRKRGTRWQPQAPPAPQLPRGSKACASLLTSFPFSYRRGARTPPRQAKDRPLVATHTKSTGGRGRCI